MAKRKALPDDPTTQAALAAARRYLPKNKPPGWRPTSRADCKDVPRPCPYVGCRYNLSLDIMQNGAVRWRQDGNWEDLFDGRDNCSLDVAARGPHTLQEIGEITGVCRERVRQEIDAAVQKLKELMPTRAVGGYGHVDDYDKSPEDALMLNAGLDPKNPDDRLTYRQMMQTLDQMDRGQLNLF
jgi:hypothetical protein